MINGGQVERLLWAAAEARRLRAGDDCPAAIDLSLVDDFVTEWQVGEPAVFEAPETASEPPLPVG